VISGPSTCTRIRSADAGAKVPRIELLFGCETIVIR
jgi:hypothetical protein